MDRAVTRSGKDADGDIIRLCNPSASWSPVSKATAILWVPETLSWLVRRLFGIR